MFFQGFTIAELLEALERHLNEPELWALCKEGIAALQRKKKHLRKFDEKFVRVVAICLSCTKVDPVAVKLHKYVAFAVTLPTTSC